MKLVTIIATLLVTANLFRDFNRDKGEHIKAKRFHFVCTLLLTLTFSGVFSYLLAVFGRFDEVKALHEISVGILPAQLILWSFMANTVFSALLMLIVFRMVVRNEKARKLLIYPVSGVVIAQTISFYRGFIGNESFENLAHWIVLLVGFIIMASAGMVILAIYHRPFMKAFFLSNPKKA